MKKVAFERCGFFYGFFLSRTELSAFFVVFIGKVNMLFDTSIKDKEIKQSIEDAVGRAYNIIDVMFRGVGNIGCSRMEVAAHSKLFNAIMQKRKQAVFANIALRPKGLIVVLSIRTSNYSWVIPYHYLSVFKTRELVIHGQGEYLKLKLQGDQNKKFIAKILQLQEAYNQQGYYGGFDGTQ